MPPPIGRVLIVDDEPLVAEMLQAVVTALGYTARTAATGPDALRMLEEFSPDVVLLDMALPDVPGEIVLDSLHATHPRLPVVMLTGNTDTELARSTLARGAFDYIAKPFKLERLRQVLEAAVPYRQ
jgi:DNA-binding NtrC family response regulator